MAEKGSKETKAMTEETMRPGAKTKGRTEKTSPVA